MTGFFAISSIVFGNHGDPPEIRTPDTLLKRQVLCLLSSRVLWQGWQDSNLRIQESKSCALPLGDIPVRVSAKSCIKKENGVSEGTRTLGLQSHNLTR